jgi:hypothetical protein
MKRTYNFKKSQVEIDTSLNLILLLVIFLVLLIITGAIVVFFNSKWSTNTCRTTVIANSAIRGSTLNKVLSSKEKIAIHCPRDKDYEILYNSVKGRTGTSTAIGYNVMNEIAKRMVDCNYRYGGDLEISPFENDDGRYCGICGKISFDEKIQKTDFGYEKDNKKIIGVVPKFSSFLLNAKDVKPKQYYSEILYRYKKQVSSDVNFEKELDLGTINVNDPELKLTADQKRRIESLQSQIGDSSGFDINIDTNKEYYISHVVFKGKNIPTLTGIMNEFTKGSGAKTALCGIASLALVATVVPSGGLSLLGLGVGAGALTTCYSGSSLGMFIFKNKNDPVPVFRITTLIPVDELDNFRCTTVYGLAKKE